PTETWAGDRTGRSTSTTSTWSSSDSKMTRSERSRGGKYSYGYTSDSDGSKETDAYVFFRDHGHWTIGGGSTRDWNVAKEVTERLDADPVLWFRHGDDQYVVTDRDLLDRLIEAMKPQEELGKRQGELGRRQGELGQLQG